MQDMLRRVATLAIVLLGLASGKQCQFTVEPWGANSLRVRCNYDGAAAYNGPGALAVAAPNDRDARSAGWSNGNIELELDAGGGLSLSRGGSPLGSLSLSFSTLEKAGDAVNATTLTVLNRGDKMSYFGFGEHENGKLDQVGLKYDMESCIEYSKSRGGEVCLPWVLVASDLGNGKQVQYGLLWNVPAYGGVDFGSTNASVNSWTAHNIDQADFFITTFGAGATGAEANAQIMQQYVDAVGHAPALPEWAAGYWHSKNRYGSQQEVAVFVIDYFNWAVMGNLTFDPSKFPDPKSMVASLKQDGTRVMVSTWPFSQGKSKTYHPLQQQGYAVYTGADVHDSVDWPDGVCGKPCYLYDASNPAAREYWWSQVKQGYFDYGIEIFWLDAAEPEQMQGTPPGSSWHAGSLERTGMMFPYYHTQTYFEGMSAAGTKDFMMLSRSAWAGMSKHHAALWNGDTHSNFDFLTTAIQAGQNVQLSGIAWWTTDIGGYAGGNPADPSFNELIVRWFQFGFTCPLFRQHGARATEPWLLSNRSFTIVRAIMALREEFKPYIVQELSQTADSGLPLNRPLWFDFPADSKTWGIQDQYMFGREYMAAPVYVEKAVSRQVYFPAGSQWQHHFTGKVYQGGTTSVVDAPLETFPLFKMMKAN